MNMNILKVFIISPGDLYFVNQGYIQDVYLIQMYGIALINGRCNFYLSDFYLVTVSLVLAIIFVIHVYTYCLSCYILCISHCFIIKYIFKNNIQIHTTYIFCTHSSPGAWPRWSSLGTILLLRAVNINTYTSQGG